MRSGTGADHDDGKALMAEVPVPADVRDAVLRQLFRQVASLDWDELPSRRKTAYYTQWVEDPAIGGELADYYTAEGMRVWLKDGPLKEYVRALEDIGSYARYTTKRLSPASEFVCDVMGKTWTIVPGSIREKPMHCTVTDSEHERYVCWGKPNTFRDLLWAAVNKAPGAPTRPLIVVYTLDGMDVDLRSRAHYQRITTHCSLDLAFVHRRLEDRPSAS
jgi:hypothetical protein